MDSKYVTLSNQKELLQFVDLHKRILVFGATPKSAGLINYLLQEGIKVRGVIVNDGQREKYIFESLLVRELSKIKLYEDDGVILNVDEQSIDEVVLELVKKIDCSQIAYNSFMNSSFIFQPESQVSQSREKGYFSKYKELQKIGELFGTDKAGDYHNYCNKYEFLLKDYREKEFTLIELGVFRGASIQMWRQYFKKARIIGVDKNEKSRESIKEDSNTTILIKDISLPESLEELREYHPSIIVDDASHIWSQQIRALFGLFDSLSDGGIYILEDIHTSFLPLNTQYHIYADQMVSAYKVVSAIAEEVTGDDRVRIYNQRELLPYIDDIERIAAQTEMVCFIHDSCILIKK